MISDEAQKLHAESIVVDLHVDPIIQQFLFGYDLREEHTARWRPQKRRWLFYLTQALAKLMKLHRPFYNHIDIPRMVAGGYTLGAFGIHHWPAQTENGWQNIQKQLHSLHTLIDQDDRVELAKGPEAVRQAHMHGKIAAFAGVEGAHCLGEGGPATEQQRLDRLEFLFHTYHVRYLTLAHFSKNDVATPALGLGRNTTDGLTRFGKTLIRKMNEIGMLVDVAHVNHQGVLDACQASDKPVIVTHAGLSAVHDHARNISDQALHALADTGGLVGVILAMDFLSGDREKPDSRIVVQHIDHIVREVGEDHAAIGTDFDGWISSIPQDMQDATDLPVLTQSMLDLGYSPERIKKILGENFLRVWQETLGDSHASTQTPV
ncbi:MAG: dipeptidase [bacterium]